MIRQPQRQMKAAFWKEKESDEGEKESIMN